MSVPSPRAETKAVCGFRWGRDSRSPLRRSSGGCGAAAVCLGRAGQENTAQPERGGKAWESFKALCSLEKGGGSRLLWDDLGLWSLSVFLCIHLSDVKLLGLVPLSHAGWEEVVTFVQLQDEGAA